MNHAGAAAGAATIRPTASAVAESERTTQLSFKGPAISMLGRWHAELKSSTAGGTMIGVTRGAALPTAKFPVGDVVCLRSKLWASRAETEVLELATMCRGLCMRLKLEVDKDGRCR